jgi:hypothetical protein
MNGTVTFRYDNNNGNYTIGAGEYAFTIHWSGANNDIIYVHGKVGYKDNSKEFPTVEQVGEFNFTSDSRRIHKGDVFVYQNQQGHFAAIKLGKVDSKSHGRHHDEMTFEYKIL